MIKSKHLRDAEKVSIKELMGVDNEQNESVAFEIDAVNNEAIN